MSDMQTVPAVRLNKKHLYYIVGIVLCAQFAVFFLFFKFFGVEGFVRNQGDALGYVIVAENMLERGVFSLQRTEPYLPDPMRTPLYPFIIYLSLLLSHSYVSVVVLQLFAIAFSAVLVYCVGVRYVHERVAFAAALLFGIDPIVAYWSNQTMTEPLYTLLLMTALYFFVRFVDKPGWKMICMSACGFGLATLVRPTLVMAVPLFLIFFFIIARAQKLSFKRVTQFFIAFIFIFFVVLAPWIYRNYRLFGNFQLSGVSVQNAYYYHAAIVLVETGELQREDTDDAYYFTHLERALAERGIQADLSLHQLSSDYFRYASEIKRYSFSVALKHPVLMARVYGAGLKQFMLGKEYKNILQIAEKYFSFDNYAIKNILLGAGNVYWVMVWVGVVAALLWHSKKDSGAVVWILFLLIVYFAATAGSVGDSRIRIPVHPLILLLGFEGLYLCYHNCFKRFSRI